MKLMSTLWLWQNARERRGHELQGLSNLDRNKNHHTELGYSWYLESLLSVHLYGSFNIKACGKGTISELLISRVTSHHHVSTGALLRQHILDKNQEGKSIEKSLAKGGYLFLIL